METSKEAQRYESTRNLVNEIGHSVADLNKICVGHLNEDFSLTYNLPYGKVLSDMTGLCIGLNNFKEANKSIFNNLSAAPINRKPPNPFTGAVDTDIFNLNIPVLECINIIESEEVQQESLSQFQSSMEIFPSAGIMVHDLFPMAQQFNTALEKVQMHYSNLAKPIKSTTRNLFGTNASRRIQQKPKDQARELFLKGVNEGIGLDKKETFKPLNG